MLGTPSRPQTAPAKSARSSEKTTPLTTLEVRRLKRLKEIEHMLKRKDMLRASPSGLYQPWSASGELPRGRRNLLPQQPAPIPPLNPRVVQQELVKARRRASRLGEWETLNRLRTPSGIAAFERRVRADSYGRVQRRVNGIHELPRSGSLHGTAVVVFFNILLLLCTFASSRCRIPKPAAYVYFVVYGVYVLYQVGGVYGAFPPVCFGADILPICL